MDLFIFLLITYTLINNSLCSDGNLAESIGLEIQAESMANGNNLLSKRVEETLNLTCSVISNTITNNNNNNIPRHKLSWHLPHFMQQNSQNRVSESEEYPNSRVLTIQNLKESDTGEYECRARLDSHPDELLYNKAVRLNVKSKKGHCGDTMFLCLAGNCIPRRYMCDGKIDCKSGEDEDEQTCGLNPCEGKIDCPLEGRCIPLHWCCDQAVEPNCTVKVRPACCPKPAPSYVPSPEFPDLSEQQRFSDMGFLQTTIYTVIGCAMAFMFIVTILVIAICRVHMKRSLLSRCPNARGLRGAGGARGPCRSIPQQVPLYDLDVFLNRATFPPEPHSGLLVTYNINNGIQFVGRPVDPPPYCEIVDSPPREGPPPPYASRENLQVEPRRGEVADTTQVASAPACEVAPLLSSDSSGSNTLCITVVGPRCEARSSARLASIRVPAASVSRRPPSDTETDEEAKPLNTDISRHDDVKVEAEV